MAMNMRRAFNSRMISSMMLFAVDVGSYNADNDWIEGANTGTPIFGVIRAGNKFSQFDEGIARHLDEGGERPTDYWSLYCTDSYDIKMTDRIGFHGFYYNVLQKSDEVEFGFTSYLLERSERWTPT